MRNRESTSVESIVPLDGLNRRTPMQATQDLIDGLRERLGWYPRQLQDAIENHALPTIAETVAQSSQHDPTELYLRSLEALEGLLMNMLPEHPEEGDLLEVEWPIEILEEKIPAAVRARSDPEKLIEALSDHSLTRLNALVFEERPGITQTEKELLWNVEEQLWREPTMGEFTQASYDLQYPFSVYQDSFSEAWILHRSPLSDLSTILVVSTALDSEYTGVRAYSHRDGVSVPTLWELAATRGKLGNKYGKVGIIISYKDDGKPRATLFSRPTQTTDQTEELDNRYIEAKRNLRKELALLSNNKSIVRASEAGNWAEVDRIVYDGKWKPLGRGYKEPLDSRLSRVGHRQKLERVYRKYLKELDAHLYEHGVLNADDQLLTLTEFVMRYQHRLIE